MWFHGAGAATKRSRRTFDCAEHPSPAPNLRARRVAAIGSASAARERLRRDGGEGGVANARRELRYRREARAPCCRSAAAARCSGACPVLFRSRAALRPRPRAGVPTAAASWANRRLRTRYCLLHTTPRSFWQLRSPRALERCPQHGGRDALRAQPRLTFPLPLCFPKQAWFDVALPANVKVAKTADDLVKILRKARVCVGALVLSRLLTCPLQANRVGRQRLVVLEFITQHCYACRRRVAREKKRESEKPSICPTARRSALGSSLAPRVLTLPLPRSLFPKVLKLAATEFQECVFVKARALSVRRRLLSPASLPDLRLTLVPSR